MPYRLDQVKEDGIYNWISNIVGSSIPVIWDKPDAIKPNLPYVTLNIIGGPNKVGNRPNRKYKELDKWNYTFVKRITLSVNIFTYGDNAGLMETILDSLQLPTKLVLLRDVGLAFWGYDGAFEDSTLVDTKWEFRSHADIFLSYGIIKEDEPGEIQKINLNGTLIEI